MSCSDWNKLQHTNIILVTTQQICKKNKSIKQAKSTQIHDTIIRLFPGDDPIPTLPTTAQDTNKQQTNQLECACTQFLSNSDAEADHKLTAAPCMMQAQNKVKGHIRHGASNSQTSLSLWLQHCTRPTPDQQLLIRRTNTQRFISNEACGIQVRGLR